MFYDKPVLIRGGLDVDFLMFADADIYFLVFEDADVKNNVAIHRCGCRYLVRPH